MSEGQRSTSASGRRGSRDVFCYARGCVLVSIFLILSQMDPSPVLRCFFHLELEKEKVLDIFLRYFIWETFPLFVVRYTFGTRNTCAICKISCSFALRT